MPPDEAGNPNIRNTLADGSSVMRYSLSSTPTGLPHDTRMPVNESSSCRRRSKDADTHIRVCEGIVLLADKTCAPTRQARGGRSVETLLHSAKRLPSNESHSTLPKPKGRNIRGRNILPATLISASHIFPSIVSFIPRAELFLRSLEPATIISPNKHWHSQCHAHTTLA